MTVPAAEPSFHVAHLNLACRDWRRSLDFYARVLGARYLFHLGPTKVVEGGVQRPDVTDLLGRNSRFSYPAIGDLGAQIACARTGQQHVW